MERQTPEQRAAADRRQVDEAYVEAQAISERVVRERGPITLGELENEIITQTGSRSHIATQAIASMVGRTIDTNPVGRLVIRD